MKLKNALNTFLEDETGAISVEFTVFWGGIIMMSYTIVGDVSHGVLNASNTLRGALDEIAATNLSLDEIRALNGDDGSSDDEDEDTGSDEDTDDSGSDDSGSDDSGSDDSGDSGTGNPGNDKDVGQAGETPNGDDDWGSGSRGRSDSNSNPGRGRH